MSVKKDEFLNSLRVTSDLVVPVYSTIPPPPPILGREGAIAFNESNDILYYSNGEMWIPLGSQGSGFQGGQGAQGYQGSQGFQGYRGFQGAQGYQGFQGAQGYQGYQGAQGYQGNAAGVQGTANQITVTPGGPIATISLPDPVIFPGSIRVPVYANVGSSSAPVNTTAGDATTNRLVVGNNAGALGGISGMLMAVSDPIASGAARMATWQYTLNPPGASSAFSTALTLSTETGAGVTGNFTSQVTGAVFNIVHRANVNATNTMVCAQAVPLAVTGFNTPSTISNIQAFNCSPFVSVGSGTGIVTLAQGLRVDGPANGTITMGTVRGISIASQSGATTNIGLHLLGATGGTNNYAIHFDTNATGTGAGIVFGTAADTSMWRGAANQLLTQGDWSMRHTLCSSTPTVVVGAAAGSGGTATISGTDQGFAVTVVTGTTATANATLFTVTFGAAFTTSAPSASWNAGNAASASVYGVANKVPYVSSINTSTLVFTSNTVPLSDSTTHIFRFTLLR